MMNDFILTPDGTLVVYILNPKNEEGAPPFWKFCINGGSALTSDRLLASTRTVGTARISTICVLKLIDGDWVHFTRRERLEETPVHLWARYQNGQLVGMPMAEYKQLRKEELKGGR